MNFWRKYMVLLAAPLALFASCTDGEEFGPDAANYVFFDVEVEACGSTSAIVKSSYIADGNDTAAEVGIMYAESGSSEFSYAPAAAVANQFKSSLTGLEPSTAYTAKAYVKTSAGQVFSGTPLCSFTTTAAGSGEFDVEVEMGGVSGVTANGAAFSGTYTATGVGEPIASVGFKYRKDGSADWTSVTASGVSASFGCTVSGLSPETKYYVRAWITADGVTYESPESSAKSFTTLASGVVPNPTSQFQWGELPVLKEMDDVVYVTHYVTSGGDADASPTTKGRVRNYSICYDEQKLQPLWVAYPMHSWYDGGSGRNESWKYDPYISSANQPNLEKTYVGDCNRGHQVASSDRQKTKAMNKQTFYYSNMSPQIQDAFNGGIWLKLENKVKDWGFGWSDTLYVVSGPGFIEDKGNTKDKDGKQIPIPSHFYKVLLSSKDGNTGKPISQLKASELRCVGFWLSHYGHANNAPITKNFMMSVAEIEEKTGFTFFPMLSEEAASVKNTYNAGDWGM